MIIAGCDVGFSQAGLGIVDTHDLSNPARWTVLYVGSCKTERADDREYVATDNVRRLAETTRWMMLHMQEHSVTRCVLELPNSGAKSSTAARAMAIATGQAVATVVALGIEAVYYLPHHTKLACTGIKDAEKSDMIKAALRVWPDLQWPQKFHKKSGKPLGPDVPQQEAIADALCALITYAKNNLVNLSASSG